MTEEQYRKHPAISQSFLKQVLKNDFTPPERTNVGNLVDSELYMGNRSKFFIGKSIPKKILDALKKSYIKNEVDPKHFLYEIRKSNYQNNWKDDTHIENMNEHLDTFIKIIENPDKILVTLEEWNKSEEIVFGIQNDPIWIENKGGIYQAPLFGKFAEIEIKGLLDQLDLDTFFIKDLKITEAKLSDWEKYVAKVLMYPFQMSFYQELVLQNYHANFNCAWLVYSTVEKRMAKFVTSENDLNVGRYGNKYVKGWEQALEIYKTCKDKKDYFYEFYKNNGTIETKIYE